MGKNFIWGMGENTGSDQKSIILFNLYKLFYSFFYLLSSPSSPSLNHLVLPWDCSLWAVHKVLEENALFLATSCFTSGCPHFIHLLHDRIISPDTGNKAMIITLFTGIWRNDAVMQEMDEVRAPTGETQHGKKQRILLKNFVNRPQGAVH